MLFVQACGSSGDAAPSETEANPVLIITPTPLVSTPSSFGAATPAATPQVDGTPESQIEPTVAADTSTQAPAIDGSSLQSIAESLVAASGGFAEVVIALPNGEFVVDINGSESMESASLYKLGIMVEVFVQREVGMLSFDDGVLLEPGYFVEGEDVFGYDDIGAVYTVETLLQAMITQSSNVAATALLATVGNENVNDTLASLGITNTQIRWMPDPSASPGWSDESIDEETPPADESIEEQPTEPPATDDGAAPATDDAPADDAVDGVDSGARAEVVYLSARPPGVSTHARWQADARADGALNVTTAEDIAWLYTLLVRGEVIAPEVSQEMLDLLAAQEVNDRIPAYLPGGTVVAHKTGNLDGLVHDAGVIYAPAGPIIVVVLTEGIDEDVAVDMIAQIALAAYEAAS